MKAIRLICMLGLIAMIGQSCSNSTTPNEWNPNYQPEAMGKKVPISANNWRRSLAQKIPGFGGLFINESRQLTIYLTHPASQTAKAKEVLSTSELITDMLSQLRDQGYSVSIANMEILNGKYTFIQLHNWKDKIVEKLLPMEGVYTIGPDITHNKVTVGVKNKTVRDKVRKKLAPLKIPGEAVIIYKSSQPVLR